MEEIWKRKNKYKLGVELLRKLGLEDEDDVNGIGGNIGWLVLVNVNSGFGKGYGGWGRNILVILRIRMRI